MEAVFGTNRKLGLLGYSNIPVYGDNLLLICARVGTVENHGNTEIMESVIFVKCRESP